MGSHDDGTIVLEISEVEARFLLRSIAATPMQGQLAAIAPTVLIGTSLMGRIQERLDEQRPSEVPQEQ